MNTGLASSASTFIDLKKGWRPIWISSLLLTLWVLIPAGLEGSQINDSLEQLIWGQSLEWGYWKHPPLTSWLVWLVTWVVPKPYLSTYLLGLICTLVTLWCTWRIGALLFDQATGDLTAVMMTLHFGFTRRAAVFNHNTVLICMVALCVWCLLLALRHQQLRWWLMLGAFSGAALLTKYQAGIPMVGIFCVLLVSGQLTKHWRQLLLAALVATLVVLPHLYWMYQHHFETIGYAMSYAGDELAGDSVSTHLYKFLGGQIRFALFPLIFMFAAMWSVRGTADVAWKMTREQRDWLVGLVAVPLLIFVLLAVWGGVRLQTYWGLQTSQFVPLLLAVWLRRACAEWGRWYSRLWLGLAFSALIFFFAQEATWLPNPSRGAELKGYPAKEIAAEAVSYWRGQTNCPLKYVSGETAPAAMFVGYSGEKGVLALQDGDFGKSPWIREDEMRRYGFLELRLSKDSALASSVTPHLNQYRPKDAPMWQIITYHAPQEGCAP